MDKKIISIPINEMSDVYETLPHVIGLESKIISTIKFEIGLLLREVKKIKEVYQEQHLTLLNQYKRNLGNGQFGSKLIEEPGKPPKVDMDSENMFISEFKKLSEKTIDLECPQIKFSDVEKIVSAKDIEVLANRFLIM